MFIVQKPLFGQLNVLQHVLHSSTVQKHLWRQLYILQDFQEQRNCPKTLVWTIECFFNMFQIAQLYKNTCGDNDIF